MKWGGYNRRGEERMKRAFGKIFGQRALYYLFAIAIVGFLLAESIKWRPGGR